MTDDSKTIYQALAAHFDHTAKLPKGGVQLDYLSLEQVVSRLNDVLGIEGWTFELREHGREADTLWSLGRLTVYLPERAIVREQFGECQTNRGMADGDARKGAASDALKKCASLVGVGLYLSEKKPDAATAEATPARQAQAAPRSTAAPGTAAASRVNGTHAPAGGDAPPALAPPEQLQSLRAHLRRTGRAESSVKWEGLTRTEAAAILRELSRLPNAEPVAF